MKIKKTCIIFLIIYLVINILLNSYSYGATFNADSPAVILFNSNTGKILYEKNAYETEYPASTTKIMTAILTIENCNLEDTTTVSSNATILPADYVSAHLQPGEVLSIYDLLHLLLIVSANDSANVLAEHIGGSIDNFVNMMNNKAKEIGCKNTHFVNPYGAHNLNHYTTAYDLCLIANYAMKNDTFRNLVSIKSYTVPATNMYSERKLTNTNLLLQKINQKTKTDNIYYYEYTTGIKTGYTPEAKNCLVASAKKDNVEYILVILGANDHETDNNSQRFSDAKKLFQTAFNNYTLSTVKKTGDIITTIKIPNANIFSKKLDLTISNDISILFENTDLKKEITPEINLYEDKIQAPISKGDVLGTIRYTYDRYILYIKSFSK